MKLLTDDGTWIEVTDKNLPFIVKLMKAYEDKSKQDGIFEHRISAALKDVINNTDKNNINYPK